MFDSLKRLADRLPRPKIAMPASAKRLTSALEPRVRRLRKTIEPAWASASAWYEKREPREKILLQVFGGILADLPGLQPDLLADRRAERRPR